MRLFCLSIHLSTYVRAPAMCKLKHSLCAREGECDVARVMVSPNHNFMRMRLFRQPCVERRCPPADRSWRVSRPIPQVDEDIPMG